MSKNSKAYREAAAKIDRERLYTPLEAVKLKEHLAGKRISLALELVFGLRVQLVFGILQ